MKQKFFLLILLCGFLVTANAQVRRTVKKTVSADSAIAIPQQKDSVQKENAGWKEQLQELDLSPEQKKQFKEILGNHKTKLDVLKADTLLTKEQIKEKIQLLKKEMGKSVMKVLNPEQKRKLLAMRRQKNAETEKEPE